MIKRLDNQEIYRYIVNTNSNVKRYLDLAPSLSGKSRTFKRVVGQSISPAATSPMFLKPNS